MLGELNKERTKWKMKKVETWREKKVRECKIDVEKCVDFFTKKGFDSITMERIKMTKWLYYYEMEGVLD